MDTKQFLSKVTKTHKSQDQEAIHIAVLYGGMSAEREVSLMSSQQIISGIIELGFTVTAIDMGHDIATILDNIKPDLVYNALYGTYGEDGCIQGMLEIMGIAYTHSGVLASAIALNKIHSQNIFIANGIKCPERKIISKYNNHEAEPFVRPYIIKPANQGSSVGVMAVFEEDNYNATDYDFAFENEAIVEKFIEGREIQVAVINGKAVGTLEIVPLKSRFYDYEAKYVDGMAKHICPAPLSEENTKKILAISEKAHNILGCRGATRVEFRYNEKEDEFYFLEINTHPGFTPLSIVPEIAAKNGISFNALLQIIIDEAIKEHVREKI